MVLLILHETWQCFVVVVARVLLRLSGSPRQRWLLSPSFSHPAAGPAVSPGLSQKGLPSSVPNSPSLSPHISNSGCFVVFDSFFPTQSLEQTHSPPHCVLGAKMNVTLVSHLVCGGGGKATHLHPASQSTASSPKAPRGPALCVTRGAGSRECSAPAGVSALGGGARRGGVLAAGDPGLASRPLRDNAPGLTSERPWDDLVTPLKPGPA